jgi:hypothetical protein
MKAVLPALGLTDVDFWHGMGGFVEQATVG